MALNDYKNLECEANGITTPQEKAKLRTEIQNLSTIERIREFWQDYEAGQNPGVIRHSDYILHRLT